MSSCHKVDLRMLADFSKHLQIGIPNPSSPNNANKSMKNKTRRRLETCYFEVGQNALFDQIRQWFKVKTNLSSLEVLLSSGLLRYLDLIFITSFYKTNIGNKRRKEAFKDHLIYHVCAMLVPETQVTLIYLLVVKMLMYFCIIMIKGASDVIGLFLFRVEAMNGKARTLSQLKRPRSKAF